MSSMIDVVFLLLIYFIVTHKQEIPEAHLTVDVGGGKPDRVVVDRSFVELEVHPDRVLLQGVVRPIAFVRGNLERLGRLDPDLTVVVKTSLAARTRELVQVLDICRCSGLTKLNVVKLR